MTVENLETDMPLTEDFAQPPLPAFGGRVRCRAIYAAAVMGDPAGRRIVQACTSAGQQARLLPKVAMKLKLADHTVALLPLTPSGTEGALLVRAQPVTAALREYIELLWERATPIGPKRLARTAERLSPAQHTVLALMAEGLHDDAIARRTGLSTTTVRRHIAALMRRLNVTSRFAAGAAAQRRLGRLKLAITVILRRRRAVELGAAPHVTATNPHVAGTVAGLGAGEARRRSLTDQELGEIVRAEVAEGQAAASEYERAGHPGHAGRLRREVQVLVSAIGDNGHP